MTGQFSTDLLPLFRRVSLCTSFAAIKPVSARNRPKVAFVQPDFSRSPVATQNPDEQRHFEGVGCFLGKLTEAAGAATFG